MRIFWAVIESICFILGALSIFLAYFPATMPNSSGEVSFGISLIALGTYIAYSHRKKQAVSGGHTGEDHDTAPVDQTRQQL